MSISQENFYRLIKPYDSNLLHVSSTMMGGASKCYKELKKVSPDVKKFSIINNKTKELYEFDINNNLQMGGGNLPGTVASLSEIELLKRHIESLEKRIIKLEDIVNIGNDVNNIEKTQQIQQTQQIPQIQQTQQIPQTQQTQQIPQGSGTNASIIENNNENAGMTLLGAQKTLPPQRPGLIPPLMKTNPTQQIHQMHQMHPMHQTNPTQQIHQMHPMHPMHPMHQTNPTQQMQQTQPFQSMNPMAQQMNPMNPMNTMNPANSLMQQKQQISAFNQELARKFI